jgi:hypothetical protein
MTNQKPNHQLIIGSSLGYWKQTEIGSDFQNWNLFIYLFIYLFIWEELDAKPKPF